TSSPYAIRSLNAATANGLSVACVNCVTSSQIQSVQGNQVTGAIPVASVPAGSTNYIQNTTSQQPLSNFNLSGNGIIGGTLGIGTTHPFGPLHVRSGGSLSSIRLSTGSGAFSGATYRLPSESALGRNFANFSDRGCRDRFLINVIGNVGIGASI